MEGGDVKEYKITIVGDSKSGKTSLISKWRFNKFKSRQRITLACDFFAKNNFDLEPDEKVNVICWDTAGTLSVNTPLNNSQLNSYTNKAHGIVIVADATKANFGLDRAMGWYNHLEKNIANFDEIPKIIMINKTDLLEVDVDKNELEQWVKEQALQNTTIELVSAKNDTPEELDEKFKPFIQEIHDRKKEFLAEEDDKQKEQQQQNPRPQVKSFKGLKRDFQNDINTINLGQQSTYDTINNYINDVHTQFQTLTNTKQDTFTPKGKYIGLFYNPLLLKRVDKAQDALLFAAMGMIADNAQEFKIEQKRELLQKIQKSPIINSYTFFNLGNHTDAYEDINEELLSIYSYT